eukprot:m.109431 g.109431  ORF g.109431 m.109431 type:complete len:1576 (-) comp12732_c0_seq1:1642-6369(-)
MGHQHVMVVFMIMISFVVAQDDRGRHQPSQLTPCKHDTDFMCISLTYWSPNTKNSQRDIGKNNSRNNVSTTAPNTSNSFHPQILHVTQLERASHFLPSSLFSALSGDTHWWTGRVEEFPDAIVRLSTSPVTHCLRSGSIITGATLLHLFVVTIDNNNNHHPISIQESSTCASLTHQQLIALSPHHHVELTTFLNKENHLQVTTSNSSGRETSNNNNTTYFLNKKPPLVRQIRSDSVHNDDIVKQSAPPPYSTRKEMSSPTPSDPSEQHQHHTSCTAQPLIFNTTITSSFQQFPSQQQKFPNKVSPRTNPSHTVCPLFLDADKSFLDAWGGEGTLKQRKLRVVAKMIDIIFQADGIYQHRDNFKDVLSFRIVGVAVHENLVFRPTEETSGVLVEYQRWLALQIGSRLVTSSTTTTVADDQDQVDPRNICLNHLFSHTFLNGILGIATQASPNEAVVGGLCENRIAQNRALNSAISTTALYGGYAAANWQTIISTTHELAHNIGAGHTCEFSDTTSSCDALRGTSCNPTDSEGGPYIMYPAIGSKEIGRNMRFFSQCSKDDMSRVLSAKGSCLEVPSVCSNPIGVVDTSCCMNGEYAPSGTPCDYMGSIAGDGDEGTFSSECLLPSACSGTSNTCPQPQFAPDFSTCYIREGRAIVDGGYCISGVCNHVHDPPCNAVGMVGCFIENHECVTTCAPMRGGECKPLNLECRDFILEYATDAPTAVVLSHDVCPQLPIDRCFTHLGHEGTCDVASNQCICEDTYPQSCEVPITNVTSFINETTHIGAVSCSYEVVVSTACSQPCGSGAFKTDAFGCVCRLNNNPREEINVDDFSGFSCSGLAPASRQVLCPVQHRCIATQRERIVIRISPPIEPDALTSLLSEILGFYVDVESAVVRGNSSSAHLSACRFEGSGCLSSTQLQDIFSNETVIGVLQSNGFAYSVEELSMFNSDLIPYIIIAASISLFSILVIIWVLCKCSKDAKKNAKQKKLAQLEALEVVDANYVNDTSHSNIDIGEVVDTASLDSLVDAHTYNLKHGSGNKGVRPKERGKEPRVRKNKTSLRSERFLHPPQPRRVHFSTSPMTSGKSESKHLTKDSPPKHQPATVPSFKLSKQPLQSKKNVSGGPVQENDSISVSGFIDDEFNSIGLVSTNLFSPSASILHKDENTRFSNNGHDYAKLRTDFCVDRNADAKRDEEAISKSGENTAIGDDGLNMEDVRVMDEKNREESARVSDTSGFCDDEFGELLDHPANLVMGSNRHPLCKPADLRFPHTYRNERLVNNNSHQVVTGRRSMQPKRNKYERVDDLASTQRRSTLPVSSHWSFSQSPQGDSRKSSQIHNGGSHLKINSQDVRRAKAHTVGQSTTKSAQESLHFTKHQPIRSNALFASKQGRQSHLTNGVKEYHPSSLHSNGKVKNKTTKKNKKRNKRQKTRYHDGQFRSGRDGRSRSSLMAHGAQHSTGIYFTNQVGGLVTGDMYHDHDHATMVEIPKQRKQPLISNGDSNVAIKLGVDGINGLIVHPYGHVGDYKLSTDRNSKAPWRIRSLENSQHPAPPSLSNKDNNNAPSRHHYRKLPSFFGDSLNV